MQNQLEPLLYEISAIFLWPALILIVLSVLYAMMALGAISLESVQRAFGVRRRELSAHADATGAASDDLELWIMKRLERLRLVARVAPLLGLVATLIPMGPALLALTENDAAEIGRNLVMAFSGVTLALIAASITFVVLNVRKRWLLEELREIERDREAILEGAA